MDRCEKCDVALQEKFIKEHVCTDKGCSFKMIKAKVCPICDKVYEREEVIVKHATL